MGFFGYHTEIIKYYEWLLDYISKNHKEVFLETIIAYLKWIDRGKK